MRHSNWFQWPAACFFTLSVTHRLAFNQTSWLKSFTTTFILYSVDILKIPQRYLGCHNQITKKKKICNIPPVTWLVREGFWMNWRVYLSLCRRNAVQRSQRKCSHRGTSPGWCAGRRFSHSELRHCSLVCGKMYVNTNKTFHWSCSNICCPVINLQEVAKTWHKYWGLQRQDLNKCCQHSKKERCSWQKLLEVTKWRDQKHCESDIKTLQNTLIRFKRFFL